MEKLSVKKIWHTPELFIMRASEDVQGGHNAASHEVGNPGPGSYVISTVAHGGSGYVNKTAFVQAHS